MQSAIQKNRFILDKRDLGQVKHLLVLWARNKLQPYIPGLGYSMPGIYERVGVSWSMNLGNVDYDDSHYGRVDQILKTEMDRHIREVIEAEYGVHEYVKGRKQKEKAEKLAISIGTYKNRLNMGYEVLIIELGGWW